MNFVHAKSGTSPLYVGAEGGHLEVVKILAEAGADINLGPADGSSPLDIAATRGFLDVVEYLIDRGADASKMTVKP